MENGYSGTPLAKKLGVRAGQNAWQVGMPTSVRSQIEVDVLGGVDRFDIAAPCGVVLVGELGEDLALCPHVFDVGHSFLILTRPPETRTEQEVAVTRFEGVREEDARFDAE